MRQLLSLDVRVPLEHGPGKRLVAGHAGNFHDAQAFFKQSADGFMAQVVEVQINQKGRVGLDALRGAVGSVQGLGTGLAARPCLQDDGSRLDDKRSAQKGEPYPLPNEPLGIFCLDPLIVFGDLRASENAAFQGLKGIAAEEQNQGADGAQGR